MNDQEVRAMVGTEFIYEFDDGDTIPAYIKACDPQVGLTCYSLEPKTTRDGWRDPHPDNSDGTFCVTVFNLKLHPWTRGRMMAVLWEIKTTGRRIDPEPSYRLGSMPSCAFM